MLGLLIAGKELPPSSKDHPSKGEWKSYRDAHIEPDWLLIYRIVGDELHLVRTGSHADLFNE
jgi:mRNA interferase YafQ